MHLKNIMLLLSLQIKLQKLYGKEEQQARTMKNQSFFVNITPQARLEWKILEALP